MATRGRSGARLTAGLVRVSRADTGPPWRCTHLDVWADVQVTRPQVAEAAFLLRPAPCVGTGDPRRDPQAAGGGTGAPWARVGYAVPLPRLYLPGSRCG